MDVRVLITRPSSDAERTAAKLRMRGIEVMFAPPRRRDLRAFARSSPPTATRALLPASSGNATATQRRCSISPVRIAPVIWRAN